MVQSVETTQPEEPAIETIEPVAEATVAVATRTVPGQRLFTARYTMTPIEMAEKAGGLATRLAMSQIRAGGEVDGPLHILVEATQGGPDQTREVLLAFPTRGNPRPSGRHRAIRTEPFRCAYRDYAGPAGGIADSWAELARATLESGHRLSGQARYVFSCQGNCSKDYVSVELQLGIE